MDFDVLLPIIVFLVVCASVVLHRRFKSRISSFIGEEKIAVKDVILLVVFVGTTTAAIAFIPNYAVQIMLIAAYSYMLFSLTYLTSKRVYLAVLPPLIFILLYVFHWELSIFNLFAALFSVMVPVFLATLFSWRTTWIFAILLTIMDVIHVYATGLMGVSATKMLDLRLPVLFFVPAYPAERFVGLGLGDTFLAGLLAIQTSIKEGFNAGILTAATVSMVIFLFEFALFNIFVSQFFPATIAVISGWMMSLGITNLTYIVKKRNKIRA